MPEKSNCNKRKKNTSLIKKMGGWRTCLDRFARLDLETQDAIIAVALMHGANWEAAGPTSTMPAKWNQILNAIDWYIDWEQFTYSVNKGT